MSGVVDGEHAIDEAYIGNGSGRVRVRLEERTMGHLSVLQIALHANECIFERDGVGRTVEVAGIDQADPRQSAVDQGVPNDTRLFEVILYGVVANIRQMDVIDQEVL